MTLLLDRLASAVERAPAQAAILAEGRVITCRQLLALVSNAARAFHEKGVRPGDIVGLAMGQSPLHLVAFLALARIGAVTLPQFPNVPAAERTHALARFGARWLATDASTPAAAAVPVIVMRDLHARGDEGDFGFTSFMPSAESPIRIALTSGTTGRQKGFLHTHGDFSRRLERRFHSDPVTPRAIPPLLHITSALQLACHALVSGGTVVFPQGKDAQGLLAAIHLHAVTHVKLPPADLAALLQLLPEDAPAFPSIRELKIVGATPSPALLRLAQRKFSPHVAVTYSISEVGMVASATPEMLAQVPGTAGRLAPGARLEVLGNDGRVLGAGERGEIRVAVDGMPQGYYGPDASLPGFRGGWFHPGDHGHVSREGFVFIEGRNDSLMNVGGHKVAPEFVESILCGHPQVAEAAAFGVDDELAGTRVAAAVVPRGTLDWRQFSAYARDALGWSAPARYFRVEGLPRNAMGKLERRELPAWVDARGERVRIE